MAANATAAPAKRGRPPATTPQARESQLGALAWDLAEKQLREGTISAQVHTFILKETSQRAQLEKEKTVLEQELLRVRVEATAANSRLEELTENAIHAFKTYAGADDDDTFFN